MKKNDLTEIPLLKDCISFLYVEMAVIEQDEFSICIKQGRNKYSVPITQFASLLVGPGVSITHEAMKNIANAGTTVIWCKRNGDGFYVAGKGRHNSTQNLIMQAKAFSDNKVHHKVVRNMYKLRFPENNMDKFSIKQMQGFEGKRVQETYFELAKKYNINWDGRNYKKDDWNSQDDVNKILSMANSILHDIVYSFLLVLGFSPDLGFIHTGNTASFAYDIADLYKSEITIPLAFKLASQPITKRIDILVRENMHKYINDYQLLKRFPKDIEFIFKNTGVDIFVPNEFSLWTPEGFEIAMENKAMQI